MQDMRNTGNRSKGCRTGGVPYREAGQEGGRTRWRQNQKKARMEGDRQVRRVVGQERGRTG